MLNKIIASRPSDHYFRSVCLSICLFVCAEFFSTVFDPTSIKLGHIVASKSAFMRFLTILTFYILGKMKVSVI